MTDLYQELENYRDSDYYPFHMPGHKRNREAAEGPLQEVYGLDITEIDGFDNLHEARGILAEEQKRASRLYGSEKTYFLVNGSTCGILSAVSAVTGRGDRILAARNCHKSVYHAIYLQELQVTYLYPEVIEEYGIFDAVSPQMVEKALKEQPDIAAVVITSPTYEGIVSPIKEIAEIVHRYGKPLIVDEAHGAHFGFHEAYPQSAVRLGADLVVQSTHKMLPAMTQTALLHVNGNLVDRERLERYTRIFQTSSPSYVLMASISNAMKLLEDSGKEYFQRLCEYRSKLLKRVEACRYIRIAFASPMVQKPRTVDPCKLVIYVSGNRLSGQQLYDILRKDYHLQPEMAADRYVLALLSLMDTKEGLDRLSDALLAIDQRVAMRADSKSAGGNGESSKKGEGIKSLKSCEAKKAVMSLAEAYEKEWEWVDIKKSSGGIAAEFINLYPPGIPLMVPGEVLDENMAAVLMREHALGLHIQGMEEGQVKVVKTG